MIFIELIGDDPQLFKELENFFALKNPTIIENGKIYLNSTEIFLSDGKIAVDTKYKKIIIFSTESHKSKVNIPKNSICICHSSDKGSLEVLVGKDVTVITYGMQKSDTVTFSSMEGNCLISLQREICDINGITIEPLEFTSILGNNDTSTLLLLNVVALITNKLEKNIY